MCHVLQCIYDVVHTTYHVCDSICYIVYNKVCVRY